MTAVKTAVKAAVKTAAKTAVKTEQETIDVLKDAGCDETTIRDFILAVKRGDEKREQQILEKHREELLHTLNAAKRQIDCLDYLVYRMERSNSI